MARIRANMAAFTLRQFHTGRSWREPDANAFVAAMTPMMAGAQQTVAAITSNYIQAIGSRIQAERARPPTAGARTLGAPRSGRLRGTPPRLISGARLRNGVDPRVVYTRPFVQVWTELADGKPLEEAVKAGERRALSIVNTDLQLAKTHSAREAVRSDANTVGFRRVPQGTYTCALCLIVSTRRYHKEDLMPVHPGCDCDVEPVYGEFDPGPVLDEDFLQAVHDAIRRDLGEKYVSAAGTAQSTRARELSYRDIIVVHQHGELGPIMGVRGQKFTGPDDIPRLTTHDRVSL